MTYLNKEELKKHRTIESWLDGVLKRADDYDNMLNDIVSHGLDGGTVNELIYTDDINEVFAHFKDEIEDLIEEVHGDFKEGCNTFEWGSVDVLTGQLTWFAVGLVAMRMQDAIEEVQIAA
jgi:hypothetical protein